MDPSANSRSSRQREFVLIGLLALAALVVIGLLLFPRSDPGITDIAEEAGEGEASEDPPSRVDERRGGEAERLSAGREADPSSMASANLASKREMGESQTFSRITGIVADLQGEPLENAWVRWIPIALSQAWRFSNDAALPVGDAARLPEGELREALLQSRAARSNAQGYFELQADQRVPGVVAASASGYETTLRGVPRYEAVTGPDGFHEIRMDFLLRFGGAISGTVIEAATGRPARGMSVVAAKSDPSRPARFLNSTELKAALVDPQGRYSLQGLAPGIYQVAPKTSYSPFVSVSFESGREVTLDAGSEINDIDFEVVLGGRITGRVASLSGEGVPGVYCAAWPDLDRNARQAAVTAMEISSRGSQETDLQGRFEFRGLPLNRSYIVRGRSSQVPEVRSQPVVLTPASPQAEVNLVISAGSRIAGRVVYADGSIPAESTAVIATAVRRDPADPVMAFAGRSDRTDEEGRFSLGPFNAGEYSLRAVVRGHTAPRDGSETVMVEVDGRTDLSGIFITLQEQQEDEQPISGMVVDDLGNPLEDAIVQASSPQSPFNSTASRSDGSFRLLMRGEGPFRVTAEKAHYSTAVLLGVELGARDVVLILDRPGQISGQVLLWGGGRLPSDGRVELFANPEEVAAKLADPRSESGTFVKPESNGTFQIGSKAGEVELVARFPGFAPVRSGPITVRSGEESAGIRLVLRRD